MDYIISIYLIHAIVAILTFKYLNDHIKRLEAKIGALSARVSMKQVKREDDCGKSFVKSMTDPTAVKAVSDILDFVVGIVNKK